MQLKSQGKDAEGDSREMELLARRKGGLDKSAWGALETCVKSVFDSELSGIS